MSDKIITIEDGTETVRQSELLSTGSTLLNMCYSGNPFGGLVRGKYYFVVGDSMSGKTFTTMTCFAEAAINPMFNDFDFIYDNVEDGMLMNVGRLFGTAVEDRMRPPDVKNDMPVFSTTIESFYYHLAKASDAGKPFIYVLDSMDPLTAEADDAKFEVKRKEFEEAEDDAGDEKAKGSYGMAKAKVNSEDARRIRRQLTRAGSILIVVSQTRDSLYGKTRGGGRALRFYATNEVWSSVAKNITKEIVGKERNIGTRVRLEMKKNRLTGKLRTAEIDIFPDSGIDDTGSCVDFLVEEKFWQKDKLTISAEGLGLTGTREKIIRKIEEGNQEEQLRELCGECWDKIEEACAVKRKNRYSSPFNAKE